MEKAKTEEAEKEEMMEDLRERIYKKHQKFVEKNAKDPKFLILSRKSYLRLGNEIRQTHGIKSIGVSTFLEMTVVVLPLYHPGDFIEIAGDSEFEGYQLDDISPLIKTAPLCRTYIEDVGDPDDY